MAEPGKITGKVLAKNTFLNLFGMLIPIIVGLISIPYAIKGLGTDGFGILSIVWAVLAYLGLLDFGLSRASTKFASEAVKEKKKEAFSEIFWNTIFLSTLLGIIGGMMIYFATPVLVNSFLNIPDHYLKDTLLSFRIFSCFLPFILLSLCLKGFLGAFQRFDLVNVIHVPASILNFVIPALSYFLSLKLSTVLVLIILVRAITAFLYFLINIFNSPELKRVSGFKRDILSKLIKYGGWITVSGIISPLLVYMDRFFIGTILSMDDVSFYSAPFEAINRLRIIPIALMTTLFPEFSALAQGENRTRDLFGRALKYVLMITGVLAAVLFVFSKELLILWLGNEFAVQSYFLVKIFLIGVVFNCLAFIPFTMFQGIGKPDIPAKFHLLELPIYAGLLWICTLNWGLKGVAIAWIFRVLIDFILLFYFAGRGDRKLNQSWLSLRIIEIVFLISVFSLLLWLASVASLPFWLLVLCVSLLLVMVGIGFWKMVIDENERRWIRSFLKAKM